VAPSIVLYDNAIEDLARQSVGVFFDLKVALLATAAYSPSQPLANTVLSLQQISSGNGYVAGGAILDGVTFERYNTSSTRLKALPVVWSAVGGAITAEGALIYDSTAGRNIALVDFDGTQSALDGTDFAIVWNQSGIISWEKAP
jgi:hypothetical protein